MNDVVNMSSSKRSEDDEEGGGLDGLDVQAMTEDAAAEADKAVAVIKTKWTPEEVRDLPISENYERSVSLT